MKCPHCGETIPPSLSKAVLIGAILAVGLMGAAIIVLAILSEPNKIPMY